VTQNADFGMRISDLKEAETNNQHPISGKFRFVARSVMQNQSGEAALHKIVKRFY